VQHQAHLRHITIRHMDQRGCPPLTEVEN
jgi:hypothetical protein